MANIIHPEIFNCKMEELANDFYEKFLGVEYRIVRQSKSITHPDVLNKQMTGTFSLSQIAPGSNG